MARVGARVVWTAALLAPMVPCGRGGRPVEHAFEPAAPTTSDARAADIMRSAVQVLEIETGRIDDILLLVLNDESTFQVAIGGVYSPYEFWWPEASEGTALERLDDQERRALLDAGEAPDRPRRQGVLFE